MGSSKKVTVGYRYFLGLHFGICHGPVDAIHKVIVGERTAWPSPQGLLTKTFSSWMKPLIGLTGGSTLPSDSQGTFTSSGPMYIYAPELFGGDKKEGGVVGTLDILMGESTQGENDYLVSKIGAGVPAFRGILSAVWRGGQVTSNNPYIKPWAFKVRRILEGWAGGSAWYPEKATITSSDPGCDIPTSVPPVTYYGTWPVLTQGVDASYAGVGELYPASLVIGPFPYASTIKAGDSSGVGEAHPDDFFVFNGTTYSPGSPNSTPIPGGTTVFSLPAGDTLTVQVKNMQNPYTHAEFVFTAFYDSGSLGSATVDMNPAHIVYQCLTDTAWGMGYPTAAIDNVSFTAVADTLYAEGFGLSLLWNQQESIEQFISIIIDHIGGILYVRPDTGAFALKLIRADYDRGTLTLYGPSNLISIDDYQRQAWGETVNEVSVVYTNPCSAKDESVTVQDLANITVQGGVVAQTRNYPGIRKASLAQRVAMRDLQALSTPLASAKISATRAAWQVFPGDVFRLSWPEYGIDDVVYRALAVNRGTLTDGQIIIDAVEDVFGLPTNTYLVEQPGEWVDPSQPPAMSPYRKMIEAPYWDLARNLSASDLAYVDALAGYLETAAVTPSGDAVNYEIHTRVGVADFESAGNGDFCPSATVVEALTKTTTSITLANGVDVDLVEPGGYAIIDSEYVLVSAIDAAAGTATISRGVFDTVPVTHTASARIWFADGAQGFSTTEYADGEIVEVKLLPSTGQGILDISATPSDSLTFDQRQYRPYAPGKVLVNTSAYPDWIDGYSELALTWAHRDRLSQTAYIVTQDEASIGPEASTTYTLRIYGETDTLIRTYSSISGASQTYPSATEISDSLLSFVGDADYYWANVKLLLHCNGADGSTTITDSSNSPLTVTAVANARIRTAQSKFGGASLYFDGTGDYVTLPAGSTWNVTTEDFTIETWVYLVGYNANASRLFQSVNGDTVCGLYLTIGATGTVSVAASSNGSSFNIFSGGPASALSLSTWHHIAYVRSGTSFTVYVNGVGTSLATSSASIWYNAAHVPVIGGQTGTNRSLNGYVDEFRFTRGVARYTANFTPPTVAFPTGGNYRLNGRLRFELESVRGGVTSYQKHDHAVLREGYGFNYGYYYGGQ